MRPRDLIGTVLGNLRRMRLKLVLTTLGVVIGTASVVMMVSIGAGLQRNIELTFERYNIATQVQVMSTDMGMPTQADGSTKKSKAKPLDDAAVKAIEDVEGVAAVMPRLSVNAAQMYLGDRVFGAQVYGVPPGALEAFGVRVDKGRMMTGRNEMVVGAVLPAMAAMQFSGPNQQYVDPYSPKAPRLDLLGKRVKLELFAPEPSPTDGSETPAAADPTGAPQTVMKKTLVTGILSSVDPMTDTSAFIPLQTAKAYNGTTGKKAVYQEIVVKTESATVTKKVAEAINEKGYFAQASGGEVDAIKQVFLIIQLVLGGVGGIALLVASLGIANTMTMSIYERTREIGVMKAVGASGAQIRQIFLGEAATIGLLGGVGGLLLSSGGASLANLFLRQVLAGQQDPTLTAGDLFLISWQLSLFAVVFATCIGLLAGILPAIRAANLDPLSALRHE